MKTIIHATFTIVCILIIVLATLVISNILSKPATDTAKVIHDEPMSAYHDILCIEEDGSAETYSIPVPVFEGFSDEFVEDYLEYAGQQFCDSIKNKSRYLHDVGEDR